MTTIQQVLFELETDYMGHPYYYLTGHALYTALARRVDAQARRSLNVSTGVFVPLASTGHTRSHIRTTGGGKAWHVAPTSGVVRGCSCVSGCSAAVVAGLTATGCAQHARRPESWRPTGVCTEGSLRPAARASEQQADDALARPLLPARRWGDEDVLPLSVDVLDGLRVGGGRNYGFGELSLAETQVIDLDDLDYSRVREADNVQLELLSPYVLQSDSPGADSQSVPWWWESDGEFRRRTGRLVAGDECHELAMIDHGQVVGYAGDRPVETAINGIQRVGTHAKFGFGEFRVRPVSKDRVPGRVSIAGPRETVGGER